MLRNVFLKTLSETRRALVWWSLGLIGMAAMMIAVDPTVRDNPDLDKMVDYPEALKAFMAFGVEDCSSMHDDRASASAECSL